MMSGSEAPGPVAIPRALPAFPPPRISGLALLGGVFLSTGQVKSAGSLHLISTVVVLILMIGVSGFFAYLIVWGLDQLEVAPVSLAAIFVSGPPLEGGRYWALLVACIRAACFLLVLKLSPLARYHAAEHKVVNAIERVGYLDLETVRSMPRQHPRCGTNLFPFLAPAMLWLALGSPISSPVIIALTILGFVLRHPLGYALQTLFTTREPNDRQLQAGIESGQRLLSLWSSTPPRRLSPGAALWQRGLLQALIGMIIGLYVSRWAGELLAHLWAWGL